MIRGFSAAVVAGALAIATAGAIMLANYWNRAENDQARTNATLEGLTAQIGTAGWSTADHVMPMPGSGSGPGYQMPPQMMPGMPTGDDARLAVPLTLRNSTGSGAAFDLPREFVLRGGVETEPRTPRSDTFGDLNRLGPGSAVDGILYFDAKTPGSGDPPLYLEWARGGQVVQLAVPLTGAAPPGHHDR